MERARRTRTDLSALTGEEKIARRRALERQRYEDNRDARLARMRAIWHAKTPEQKQAKSRRNKLISEYGMRPEDYDRMHAEQGGRCAICREPGERNKHGRLFVDHCHETGHVRGLLCDPCNRLLGCARDRLETLQAAMTYLLGLK